MLTDWKTYLTTQGAIFNDGQLTGFSQTPAQLNTNTVCVLSKQSLVSVEGVDRQKFLQGQISTHMTQLNGLQHSTGVACSPKGRMYTTFRVLNTGERYLLAMNSTLTGVTIETLSKYAVFFQVRLTPQPDYLVLGLSGDTIKTVLSTLFHGVSLPENRDVVQVAGGYLLQVPGIRPRYELWLVEHELAKWWPELTQTLTPGTDEFWQLLDIESVIPGLTLDTVDKYIPQHLNQPSLGGVSFKKGCYTGQEIVARTQNLGQLKSRCYHLSLVHSSLPEINTRLYNGDGKPVGEIVAGARNLATNTVELLAVIRIDAAAANDVFLDPEKDQPLQVNEIPYPIDPRAELQQ